ncbi:MAG: hypothetical protein ACI8Y7_000533 [Candidatus Woesearchaeota archaeon]|jgi:uncharacterized protein (UPF0333 family)
MLYTKKKGQTSTEYILLLAVGIIVALLVLALLGKIGGIGQTVSGSSSFWSSTPVGVSNAYFTEATSEFSVVNNNPTTCEVISISILMPDGSTSDIPIGSGFAILRPGQQMTYTPYGWTGCATYEFFTIYPTICYECPVSSGATFCTGGPEHAGYLTTCV